MSKPEDDQLLDRVRRLFGDAPIRLQVAALPWRIGAHGPEVLLVTSRDTGRWVLPKGWIEKDEKPWRAAEREAAEEAGVHGDISRDMAGRYFYAKVRRIGRANPCEVHVFPLAVNTIADSWREKDERERRWFSPEEAAGLVEEPDLGDLIRHFGLNGVRAA